MNTAPTISAVVPIYNSRPYLFQDGMLSSLLGQTLADFEIVLVNDGSTDDSLDICRAYAAADNRIRVVTQDNGGESAARNTGIEAATGDYVSVVDHDDFLSPNAYELMSAAIQQYAPDIVRCNFLTVGRSKTTRHASAHSRGGYDRGYIRRNIIPAMIGVDLDLAKQLPGHWTYLHRRKMLLDNQIRYDQTKRKETDHRFIVDALNAADNIALIDDALYHFVKRAGSNTSSYSPRFDNIMDNFEHYEHLFGSEYDFTCPAKIAYNVSFVEECVFYVLVHEQQVDDKKSETIRILSDAKVVAWYRALAPQNRFSGLVRKCVVDGRFDAAYLLFEAAFLKSRIGRLARG